MVASGSCKLEFFWDWDKGGVEMYFALDFNLLSKEERKYLRKQKVEERLNEMVEFGRSVDFSKWRFAGILRHIRLEGILKIRWEEKQVLYFYKIEKRKVFYEWSLPGYEKLMG